MHHALPLDFSLRNGNDEAVLFLDGPQDLTLRLYNNAAAPLFLNPLTKEHHFTLRFRAGVLRDPAIIRADGAAQKHWDIDTRQDAGDVVIGLRRKAAMTWAPDHKLHLTLEGVRGESAGGTRATRVELTYDHIRLRDEDVVLPAGKPRHHQLVLMTASPWGAQGVPLLEMHVVGPTGNVVVNDGAPAAEDMVLRLTNATQGALRLGHDAELRLTLADGAEDEPGALATREALLACTVTADLVRDPAKREAFPLQCRLVEDGRVTWTIRGPENPGDHLVMDPPGYIEILVTGLVTSHKNGPSNVHARWINLGYADRQANGATVATLQKSPIVVAGRRLGIGTSRPQAALDVRGDMHIAGRITSDRPLEFDAFVTAGAGLAVGGVRLLAPKLHATVTTRTEAKHFGRHTVVMFQAFDGWPLSLPMLDPDNAHVPWGHAPPPRQGPPTFTLPLPPGGLAPLAMRGSLRVTVTAEAGDGSRCPVSFASSSIPVALTCSGDTLIAAAEMRGAANLPVRQVPVGDTHPVDCVFLHSWLCPGVDGLRPTQDDLASLRDMLAAMSAKAGDWARSFGDEGVDVVWTVEATCTVAALLPAIDDPS